MQNSGRNLSLLRVALARDCTGLFGKYVDGCGLLRVAGLSVLANAHRNRERHKHASHTHSPEKKGQHPQKLKNNSTLTKARFPDMYPEMVRRLSFADSRSSWNNKLLSTSFHPVFLASAALIYPATLLKFFRLLYMSSLDQPNIQSVERASQLSTKS